VSQDAAAGGRQERGQEIAYKHDVTGRRVEKKVDGYSTRYIYDGDHVVAEYDGNNNLLRKYIYGPGIDQPVCMIEVADSNAVYYYHFDALGSVVALSDASGDTVQTYEYADYCPRRLVPALHTQGTAQQTLTRQATDRIMCSWRCLPKQSN